MSSLEWDIRSAGSSMELARILKRYSESMDSFDWVWTLKSQHFSDKFYSEYEKHIPWDSALIFRKVPLDIVEKHFDEMDIYEISAFQQMTPAFLKKHQHQLALDVAATNENLSKEALEFAKQLRKKYDDPSHHKLWDWTLQNNRTFCPKNFRPRYNDYDEKTPMPNNIKAENHSQQTIITKEKISEVKNVKSKTTSTKPDYSNKSKAELKKILEGRGIRVYYHDTLDILREKCRTTEKSSPEYEKLTKAQLREILEKRKVKVLYHDTIEILVKKCKESEVKN